MVRISVAAVVALLSLSPVYAGTDLCTDAHMQKMDQMIAAMTDEAKKKEATMHLDMSKEAMKAGDMDGCMKHMDEAHKAMGLG